MTLMEWLALVLLILGSAMIGYQLWRDDELERRIAQGRPTKARKLCR